MNENKLYVRQICLVFGAFTIAGKLITMPALAAKYAKEALWISAGVNFLIDGLALLFFLYLAKKFEGMTIFQIVEYNLGKVARKIFAFIFFAFFILKSYLPIIEHRNFVEVALYETSPALWIFAPIFLFTAFFSYKGLKAIARTADIAIWFTIPAIVVIASLSISVADFSNLLPIIDVSAPEIIKGSFMTSLWFFDSPYLLFFLGHFKSEKKQSLKISAAYFGFATLVLIYMAIMQCEFGTLTERQFFSPVKMGKYSVAVSNIGRIDYLAVFALIFSCVFGVGLPLVFATKCLNKCFNFKHRIIPCLIVNGMVGITILLTENYYFLAREFFQKYITPFFAAVVLILPLFALFFRRKSV